MNRSAIIESEFSVLEDAIIEYGTVVTFKQIQQYFNKDIKYTRKRISRLVEQGWLTRVKKGLFAISDLSTRGTLSIDHRVVVNLLIQNAYISFQSALQFHGIYDQLLSGISAVSLERHKKRAVRGYEYRFVYTQEKYYYGWDIYEIDGREVKIADIEKALIDMIQFHRTVYTTDIVLEKILDYQDEIDHEKFTQYLLKSNLVTRRIFGFLLDCAGMDTQQLLNSVARRSSVSSISKSQNNIYNHKWKLYYDQHFTKYVQ